MISYNNNRSRVFREIYKILKLANNNAKILLFGGSERENFYIRGPREIISIFHSIFNLNLAESKRIVRENPSELMNRLILRNNPDHLQTGVEIVNRFKKKNNDFIRRFTAGVKIVELDASGRLLIPKDLVVFAGIFVDYWVK